MREKNTKPTKKMPYLTEKRRETIRKLDKVYQHDKTGLQINYLMGWFEGNATR